MTLDLSSRLGTVVVTEPILADGLQVFGLSWEPAGDLDYITLDEALTGKVLEITEVSEAGSVPTLLVQNKADRMVFLTAGAQLIGAKQNRVLNVSLMVAAGTRLAVPVSRVEAGRWGYRSHKFSSGGSSLHARLRKMMSIHATESYRAVKQPRSRQGEVWDEVNFKLGKLGSHSPSFALEQAYHDYEPRLADAVAKVQVPPNCQGIVFAFGGRIAGLDLFDKPATLHKLLSKLVKAYAIDALEEESKSAVDRAAVEHWLQSASAASFERFDLPGLGDDVRVESAGHVGAGLVVSDCPVHVELFPREADEQRRPDRARPPQTVTPPTTPPAPAGPSGIVCLATSETLLRALGTATAALAPTFATAGLPLNRSGLLLRVRNDEQDRLDASNLLFSHADEAELIRRAVERFPTAALRMVFTGCGLADN